MSKWKTSELGNVITLKRGYDLPQQKRNAGLIPIFSSSGVSGCHNTAMVKAPGVVTGRYGTIGQVFYAEKDFWPLNTTLYVESFHGNDPRFIYYFLKTLVWEKFTSASAVPGINRNTVHKEIVRIPDVETQKKIAKCLLIIDEKIKNNEQINDNLQQQLATIYKAWYQDFSLVSNPELIETEYGLIPQGWHYALVGDLCQSISVTHRFDKEELVFLNTGDVEDGRFLHSEFMAVKKMPGQAKKTIAPGDILYSEIRPINRHFAYVNFPSADYVVSTKFMVIRAKSLDSRRLYHYLTSENVLTELQLQAESRSGTFPQIRFDNVSRMPILIADEQTEHTFIELLHKVYNQIEHLNRENNKLSELRDSLLPKLMSGEIDVSAIYV